jgi:hypothetical protein
VKGANMFKKIVKEANYKGKCDYSIEEVCKAYQKLYLYVELGRWSDD